MSWDKGFETAFNPRGIAIVGTSRDVSDRGERLGRGSRFILRLRDMGYQGRIYPVNPQADEIYDLKAYPSVSAIDGHVDLVIISVPAGFVPGVLEDCGVAGVKNIQIFTAGFSETGTKEGRLLEEKIKKISKAYGLRVVGPNCMGIAYIPKANVGTIDLLYPDAGGEVAFLSQSGGHCTYYVANARDYGIKFSKVISYGNATVMDSTDFLEYLAGDPESQLICLYIEGVREGRKLFSLIKETNREKPVILWKGGTTGSGLRAAVSHTGSLAGDQRIWDALFKQTGAVRVNSLEEMIDVTRAFLSFTSVPKGKRVIVLGVGGGASVAVSDVCSAEGLDVSPLGKYAVAELATFIPFAGHILVNPLDLAMALRNPDLMKKALDVLAKDQEKALFIFSLPLDVLVANDVVDILSTMLASFSKRCNRPVAVVLYTRVWSSQLPEVQKKLAGELTSAGIVVYSDLTRAARALSRFTDYHHFLKNS